MTNLRSFAKAATRIQRPRRASVIVEYLLLCTIVGIGVLVGLAAVRAALVSELQDVATAIEGIT